MYNKKMTKTISNVQVRKKFYMVLLLQMFGLGMFGIDRFYMNKNGHGTLMLICTISFILNFHKKTTAFLYTGVVG